MSVLARPIWRTVYAFILFPLLLGAAGLLSLGSRKLRGSLRGRRGLWRRMGEQLAARDPARPLVWFHVASAGEFLQALPVLERLAAAGAQCALTVTSISGYDWIQRRRTALPGVVVADYLPLDSRRNMRRLLALLRPRVLVHVKFDLWPNLIWEAQRAGVPQVLISATLQPRSRRLRWPLARSLYRDLYGALDAILAVTEEDRLRFLETGPTHPNVRVVGDTRYDSVLDRKRALKPAALPPGMRTDTVLVVGSCWPPDEERLFPVIREALQALPALRVILAPHEIAEPHLRGVERYFAEVPMARLSGLDATSPAPLRLVLVDSVGLLAGLYAYATLAYVGGGFTTGVHNVMEPAAMGAPAVFGPIHHNSPEAVELARRGKAFAFRTREELEPLLLGLLQDPERCKRLGHDASAFIEARAGAARACFEIIQERLP
jgi:3-deoxy-D-manno-octulosonic-acid transferase